MKAKILAVLAVLSALLPIACATTNFSSYSGARLADLQLGKKYYVANCAACHNLHDASEFSPSDWKKIMVKMQKKAKIDDSTKDSIMDYLTTATTKRDVSEN